jgi:ABC-2 type transport system ATP-binding protein
MLTLYMLEKFLKWGLWRNFFQKVPPQGRKKLEKAIAFENVSKSFNGLHALDEVSLAVPRGQVFGLIGPDGAGKTTAIRIMATLLLPDSGRASVLGFDVKSSPFEIKRRIGYMPQNFSLYRDLTVMENVEFYAGIYKVEKKLLKERVEKLLDFTGLKPFTNRIADALSGGMKQKLALACSLIHEPELVLLDEPTTGVDPVARRQFWKILDGLVANGMTVLVSTPYMDEAERCHRIAFMNKGKIVKEGLVDELRTPQGWKLLVITGPNVRELAQMVKKAEGVLFAQPLGNSLRVQVKENMDLRALRNQLPQSANYRVEELKPSLEDVFANILSDTE